MLALHDIVVRKGNACLLDGISLEIHPGEVLAVVGPNGAGKTTLLRAISGEEQPTSGFVTLDGEDITALPPEVLAARRAVLPQTSTLSFGFSVLDVVLLGRIPHKTSHFHNLDATRRAMEEANITHLASRSYPTLSGGEKQRVHFARTMAQLDTLDSTGERKASYLLLDEPTSALDLNHQQSVLSSAQRRAQQGMGVLAVLHDLNLASQAADQLIVLREGRILAEGPPSQILNADLVRAAFDVPVIVLPHPCLACPLVVHVPDSTTADGYHIGDGSAIATILPDLSVSSN